MLRKFLNIVDRIYRWIHRLESTGSIFYIGLKTYKGALLTLSDGTAVRRGDRVCTLHFNNERVALIHNESKGSAGFLFARHVTLSLSALAEKMRSDKAYEGAVALSGVTWMPREGAKKIGFDSYPVGGVCRLLWLRIKFSLYLLPVGKKRSARKIKPHALWMSRKRLLSQRGSG
jgi:hypothetical protein